MAGIRRWLALPAALAFAPCAMAEPRPFRLDGGRIATLVRIEEREVLALIDTGAWGSSIEQTLADELEIGSARAGRTYGASGAHVAYRRTQGVSIDLGGGVAGQPRAAVTPDNGPADGPRAVIGMDMLADAAVSIDFDAMTIDFTPSRRFTPPAAEPLKLEGQWEQRRLRVAFGGRDMFFAIDTAASSALHLMLPEMRARELLRGLMSSRTLVEGVDGLHEQAVASMPEVVLTGVRFENVPFTLSPRGTFSYGANGVQGVIGVDMLRRFNAVLDYGRDRVWLTPNGARGAPFRRNRIGVVSGPGGTVALVAPGSPAERAGFRAGDVIARWEDEAGAPTQTADVGEGEAVVAVMADGTRRRLVAAAYY
jgi:predicted aspartyl protease